MTLSVRLIHARPGFRLDAAFEAPGGVTALFGHSGAGKTTVVNAVAGLLRPDAGRVALDGRVLVDTETRTWLPPHRRRIGYVFQDARLFPHMTVQGNLLYGARLAPRGADGPTLDRVTEMLGIGLLLHRRPGGLSGGERSRVALGRALLSKPQMLLMDEPLSALDPARKEEILPYLERLRDEAGVPILYVTHAAAEVARLATTVVLMKDGGVLRAGPAAELLADPDIAPAFGIREAGAVIEARVAGHDGDGLTRLDSTAGPLLLPHVGLPPGSPVRVRIAAQDVILARHRPQDVSALNILPAVVMQVRPGRGPGALVQLRAGGEPGALILARVTARSVAALDLAPGVACHALVKSVAVARDDIGMI